MHCLWPIVLLSFAVNEQNLKTLLASKVAHLFYAIVCSVYTFVIVVSTMERKKYTPDDDYKLIKFAEEKEKSLPPMGNALWKLAQLAVIDCPFVAVNQVKISSVF